MTRRRVLQLTSLAGAAMLLPRLALSQTMIGSGDQPGTGEAQIVTEISANHGHQLSLSPVSALVMLRETKQGQPVMADISGQSGHPHTIELNHADLLALFVDGQIVKVSSRDLGHQHQVTIRLEILS